ncbi:hypothetical protein ACOMHN_005994 [Nucella lapillus]
MVKTGNVLTEQFHPQPTSSSSTFSPCLHAKQTPLKIDAPCNAFGCRLPDGTTDELVQPVGLTTNMCCLMERAMATLPHLGSSIPLVLLLAVVAVTCLCQVTAAWRVLLVPLPDTSQCRQMVSLGRELKTRGHQVILFVPDYFRARRCTEPSPPGNAEVEIRPFDTSEEEAGVIDDKLERLGDEVMRGGTGLLGDSSGAEDAMRDICSSYMEARDDMDQLRREGKVDIVVVDGSPVGRCLTLLPAYLGAPFVAMSSFIDPFDSSLPLPTSFYPAPLTALPGNMAFFQRLFNFLGYATYGGGGRLWRGFHQGNSLGERVNRLDSGKLIKKALLYLENSDYIIDYPKAIFPNFLQVGGLTASPANPLPGPLAKFFDGDTGMGVIVVSLGPHVFTPNKNLEDKLLTVFRRLDSRVLLRLNASRSLNRLKHVQTVSWFPQNDALGNPNTRLFVSHCGKNSFFEALYHGVPLLCCHFAGSDVLGTAARVAEYGVGLSLDLLTASADSIATAITTLLTEKAYARRMKAASKLFHSRSQAPAARAASAIEHVLRYGGGYLRPRSIEMTFFQYAGLDIALVLFTVVLGVIALISFLVVKYLMPLFNRKKVLQENCFSATENTHSPVKVVEVQEKNGHASIAMYVLFVLVALFYIFV